LGRDGLYSLYPEVSTEIWLQRTQRRIATIVGLTPIFVFQTTQLVLSRPPGKPCKL